MINIRFQVIFIVLGYRFYLANYCPDLVRVKYYYAVIFSNERNKGFFTLIFLRSFEKLSVTPCKIKTHLYSRD